MKLLTIIGARPQFIKAAALSRAIKNSFSDRITEVILHTGQHYDDNMSRVFFNELEIPAPDYNLRVGSASHGVQTAEMLEGIEGVILIEEPDCIILYGDTNSTLAGAVAAAKLQVPVVHIEAGLRSYNKSMPEEINRIVCDHCSTLLFSPTMAGYSNLIKEGFNPQNDKPYTPDNPGIFHCGDVMYDNTLVFDNIAKQRSVILEDLILEPEKYILTTLHRPANTDDPQRLEEIMLALDGITRLYNLNIVLPLHPRTAKMIQQLGDSDLKSKITKNEKLKMIPAVSFLDMTMLETNASMIITDSGGVQKEAYFFQKPCIILRNETEWVEIVENGCAILAGTSTKSILDAFNQFMNDPPKSYPSLFGDGRAAEFICGEILQNFSK
ncbi:MAG: UDP-N-acetylglucosamine 2-epimerase (non-hydrolyzing) [Bacteroidales bacterium]|nr:UDP-N-acetylglucosamine 2-epimerase (non-hydrolyzing) [Bacteroidales bacterium]